MQRGNTLPPAPVSTLIQEWGCHLTAGTCRQLYCGVCFIAPWDADIVYHNLFWVDVSCSSIVGHINEQFIVGGCSLSVACSMSSGYSCHIGLDTIENYLILRAVILSYIYGICVTTPARAVVVAPRQVSGLTMLWPRWGAFLDGGAFLS